ncbi:MAG: glycine cleavage system protein GcvH [Acholeplasmataceae bacterium]|nr:glycine cleavage system protein GcvH [Acholeplasmataceae bacterium]HQD92285.1 glycine cleavage system protein GcvH [Bacilli bacterium]
MSKVMEGLKYTHSHEWVKVENDIALIGITDYAQDSLGDVVYVDAGEVGMIVEKDEMFGSIESVKAASDLFSPVSGEIIEINQEVIDNPELINEDCYANWIIKVRMSNQEELNELMDASEYQEHLE